MTKQLEINYFPGFLNKLESDSLFSKIKESYFIDNSVIDKMPRQIKWFGDLDYSYSNIVHKANPMPDFLIDIKNKINLKIKEFDLNSEMNSVLVNHYRDGKDKISWHSDDLSQIGDNPVISSLSLGDTRLFKFRHKETKEIVNFELNSGDLFIMYGSCQEFWQHSIPSEENKGGRINLTFRNTKR